MRLEAQKVWKDNSPINKGELQLTLVYLCDEFPADIDNIIKPIQDALVDLVFEDDSLVSDVDSHRRFLSDPIEIKSLPSLLQRAVLIGKECVYVKVSEPQPLEKYL
ncbi:MAG: RusA family crossover junction endodeoxyribonuclease [Nostoc sp.]|uniref:RusA family crossover junction endodeoxyribonuclease n=1 Tax=Nostoc sp. TaxID=1180 RepID=UPI002FF72BA1